MARGRGLAVQHGLCTVGSCPVMKVCRGGLLCLPLSLVQDPAHLALALCGLLGLGGRRGVRRAFLAFSIW